MSAHSGVGWGVLAPQKAWLGANASFCSHLLKNILALGSLQVGSLQSPARKLLFASGGAGEGVQSALGLRADLSSWEPSKACGFTGLGLTRRCSQGPRIKLGNGDRICPA